MNIWEHILVRETVLPEHSLRCGRRNAVRVSVVGDFNNWDGRIYPMIKDGTTGIFDLFIPDVQAGDCYKYEIRKKGRTDRFKGRS